MAKDLRENLRALRKLLRNAINDLDEILGDIDEEQLEKKPGDYLAGDYLADVEMIKDAIRKYLDDIDWTVEEIIKQDFGL
jgi:hypothetical protein